MAPPLLTLQDMQLTFGSTPLLTGADLSVSVGDRVCLVGRNGSGKSTLLKMAAGLIDADSGKRFVHPGANMRYLHQEVDFGDYATTLSFVEAGLSPTDDPYKALYLLNELGLSGEENPAQLSGGEARRVALAQVLAPQPDILLLDEPTNHLDLPVIEWLENELKSMRSALVLISHDRRFLETLSKSTLWLDRGRTQLMTRGFAHFESWRDELLEREEQERHKLDRKIAAEEHWIRYGVSGRRKRNMRRVAELADLRQTRKEDRRVQGNVAMQASQGEKSGKLVAELKHVSKSYDDRPIVANLTTRIARGDCIGIVGPNGAGKTTLLKLITGTLQPDEGTVRLGAALQMVTLDQRRDELLPDQTVTEALTGGRGDTVEVNGVKRHVIGYMKDFLFAPEQARTPLKVLSGGERGRLMLARALAKPSNLLILDEPTNDLDLETLDLLQELLADYKGTVLLVSHDRDFIDRVVTSVIAFEGEGRWVEYAGGYSDMLVQRRGARKQAREQSREQGGDVGSAEPGSRNGKRKRGARKGARNTATSGAAPVTSADTAPAASSASLPTKKKLTFKDQHALKTLPQTISKCQQEITAQEAVLASPDLFSRDPPAFETAVAALQKAREILEASEDEWLRLEMLREETGS